MKYDHEHVSRLSKRLVDRIMGETDHVIRNGDPEHAYPGTENNL